MPGRPQPLDDDWENAILDAFDRALQAKGIAWDDVTSRSHTFALANGYLPTVRTLYRRLPQRGVWPSDILREAERAMGRDDDAR